jgi:hypothetical protein
MREVSQPELTFTKSDVADDSCPCGLVHGEAYIMRYKLCLRTSRSSQSTQRTVLPHTRMENATQAVKTEDEKARYAKRTKLKQSNLSPDVQGMSRTALWTSESRKRQFEQSHPRTPL